MAALWPVWLTKPFQVGQLSDTRTTHKGARRAVWGLNTAYGSVGRRGGINALFDDAAAQLALMTLNAKRLQKRAAKLKTNS